MASREEADSLKGGLIQVLEEERYPLPADHYYRYEIVGLDVFLEDGTSLGKVEAVLETGGNDVYLVKQDAHEYYIPALKQVVKKIDVMKKEMTICPMEGLLDL